MNTIIKTKRNRYEELRSAIQTVRETAQREDRDLSEPEMRQVEEYAGECRSLWSEIEELAEEQHRSERVAQIAGQVAGGGEFESLGAPKPRPADPYTDGRAEYLPPKLMPSREQVEALYAGVSGDAAHAVRVRITEPSEREHLRAAVTTAQTGTASGELDARPLREPRRLATTAGLLTSRVNGVSAAKYPIFGAGVADIVAEGAAKPEYAAVTPGSSTPQVISVWEDFSRQALTSMLTFEDKLRNKLARLVAVREDKLLVATALATSGIQVFDRSAINAERYGDSLLGAAGLVVGSDVAAEPDVAVVNPTDIVKIFGGANTGPQGETPQSQLRLQLHGMTLYPSSAVTAGTALVGAWSACARFVDGLGGVMYLVDGVSQMKNNLVTLLAEEAVNLAVEEPSGFVNVTFSTTAP